MANQPRPDNRARAVRIEDPLWHRVTELAAEDTAASETRVTASDIVRTATEQYLRRRDAAARRRKPHPASSGTGAARAASRAASTSRTR